MIDWCIDIFYNTNSNLVIELEFFRAASKSNILCVHSSLPLIVLIINRLRPQSVWGFLSSHQQFVVSNVHFNLLEHYITLYSSVPGTTPNRITWTRVNKRPKSNEEKMMMIRSKKNSRNCWCCFRFSVNCRLLFWAISVYFDCGVPVRVRVARIYIVFFRDVFMRTLIHLLRHCVATSQSVSQPPN